MRSINSPLNKSNTRTIILLEPNQRTLEKFTVFELRVLLLLGAIQFINILDFMMVLPLGPDFAGDLKIPLSELGKVGGSYSFAAFLGGLVGMGLLPKFAKRVALGVLTFGPGISTVWGGLAQTLQSLLSARLAAGLMGGPATAVALALVSDVIHVGKRGRAMGALMMAFSVPSVAGVPLGLELARLGTWRTPFFVLGGWLAYFPLASDLRFLDLRGQSLL